MVHRKKRGLYLKRILPKNQRGISAIIATLLLILLTVVITGILWAVIRNITSSASGEISLSGLTLDLEIQSASVESETLFVNVQRQPGAGELTGIRFIVSDDTESEVVNQNVSLEIYGGKQFSMTLLEVNPEDLKTVSVAPLYLSSGSERVGSVTDTYTFTEEDFTGSGSGTGGYCGDGTCQVGESCTADCGGSAPICGDGTTESPETCDDGNSVTEVCDYGEQSCQICNSLCHLVAGETAYCGNGICDSGYGESTSTCIADCTSGPTCEPATSCGAYECGNPPDGCGGFLDCNSPPLGCDSASFCNTEYVCEPYIMVNAGDIFSVWPSGAVMFFDSGDLPPDAELNYNDGLHYVRFPGSAETNCLRVALANYIPENERTYIALYAVADITENDNYQIWNSQAGCLSHPGYE